MKEYFSAALKFIGQIEAAIPIACQLLDSQTSSDVLECVQFFVMSHIFFVEEATTGIKKMLKLIWAREQPVRDGVVDACEKIFFKAQELTNAQGCIEAARSMIKLVSACTLAELSALEGIIGQLVKQKRLPQVIILALWELYELKNIADGNEEESVAAVILLKIIAQVKPSLVRKRFKVLMNVGLGERVKALPFLATHTCAVLEQLGKVDEVTITADESVPKKKKAATKKRKSIHDEEDEEDEVLRFAPDHTLFRRLTELLISDTFNVNSWLPFAEKAINVIFALCEKPDVAIKIIIVELKKKTFGSGESQGEVKVSSNDLIKLLFVLGHGALKELVYTENEFKNAKKAKSGDKKTKEDKPASASGSIEDELGLDPSSVDDHELEEFYEQKERNIVSKESIYGSFVPLILSMCADSNNKNITLTKSAILALCKYMCISTEFCEKHIQFLFTLLAKAPSSDIRTNIIVGIGDLACRFPNTVEPWTNNVYSCLRDKDRQVRKHTLMVLTHLVLNDMVKVKANISDIARCIEDEDENIVNLTKSFFNELSRRATATNNPIYNLLPEILSRLSSSEDLSDESFRNIMKYILGFITRDKQTEQLVEKLCQRFKSITDSIDQWRDLSFCLSLLNLNEKCVRKVIDNIKYYHHALVDTEVYNVMKQIADKGKKVTAKPSAKKESGVKEYKQALDDWEKKIDEYHAKLSEDSAYYQQLKDGSAKVKLQIQREEKQQQEQQAQEASSSATKEEEEEEEEDKPKRTRKLRKAPASKASKQKKGGRRKAKDEEEEEAKETDEDSEPELMEEVEDDEEEEEAKPKRKTRKAPAKKAAPKRGGKRKKVVDDEEEKEKEPEEQPDEEEEAQKKTKKQKTKAKKDETEEEEEPASKPQEKQKTKIRTRSQKITRNAQPAEEKENVSMDDE